METWRMGNRKTNRAHPNYRIFKTDHNTEKRLGNLRTLAVTPVKKKHQLTLFAFLPDPRIILKESEKKYKYLELARELKKLWNMKETIILIVIGAFGTVTKRLWKGPEDLVVGGRVVTIRITALLRTAKILRSALES